MPTKDILRLNLWLIGGALVLSSAVGCAQVKHVSVPNDQADLRETGIRYYEASPYLIVYANGKGGLHTEVVYLPDPNRKMAARPKAHMAQLRMTMEFENGVLTSAKDLGDGTAVPLAIAKAIEIAAEAFIAAMNKTEQDDFTVPAPSIYKIVVEGAVVRFVGGEGDQDIMVTLTPDAGAES